MTNRDSVTKALIPCGGKGTRLQSVTGGSAKELIEVAGIPLVVRVLGECAASGITDVLVVVAPGKEEILEKLTPLAGTAGMPAKISFATQNEARGLADAIRLGRVFAAGQPLAVALPDNLFDGGEPALLQVIETHLATQQNVVAVVEIFAADAATRGPTSVYSGFLEGDEFRITKLPGKGERTNTFDTGGHNSAFTGVGRFVFDSAGFDAIDQAEQKLAPGAELDDVPVMQMLLAEGRLTGRRINGRFYDVGLVPGYREAVEHFGGATVEAGSVRSGG